MNTADDLRLRTWAIDIALTLLPEGTTQSTEGHNTRFHGVNAGGLSIVTNTGVWWVHALGRGGESAIGLIQHLRACSHTEAVDWSEAWLASHAGTGSCDGAEDAAALAAGAPVYAEIAKELLAHAVPAEGTAVEAYLRSRDLVPPYPDCVRFVPDVRVGEHAIVGVLSARGRTVGVQVGFLTPDGRKTPLSPQRRVYYLERDAGPEGVFAIRVPGDTRTASLVVGEGLEDGLALAEATVAPWIAALPGIGGLVHLEVPPGTPVTVFRHGDDPGSAADRGLIAGLDKLLLAGIAVRSTPTPIGADANSILLDAGPGEVAGLLRQASAATLSLAGEVQRLSKLDAAAYDQERTQVARRLGIRVGTLDATVARARGRPADAGRAGRAEGVAIADDPPWAGPIALCWALDTALEMFRQHVVAEECQLAVAVLWCAHSFLVHNDKIQLEVSPRLLVQAPTEDSGKSILLRAVSVLSHRVVRSSALTSATVFRVVDLVKPTLIITEAEQLFSPGTASELLAVIDASNMRSEAFTVRNDMAPDGTWTPRLYSTWHTAAFGSIGALPRTLQSRGIVIRLRAALPGEVPAQHRRGVFNPLVDQRRMLTAWGASLEQLPEATLPEGLFNRAADLWEPLFAVANLAGGRWPSLVAEAAQQVQKIERPVPQIVRLLAGIRTAFGSAAFLETEALIRKLLADPEEDWRLAYHGKSISAAWLRERLANLLDPPGSQQSYFVDDLGVRRHRRGYDRRQFQDAFSRYLPPEAEGPTETMEPSPAPTPSPTPSFRRASGSAASSSSGGVEARNSASLGPASEPDAYSGLNASGAAEAAKTGVLAASDADEQVDVGEPVAQRKEGGREGKGEGRARGRVGRVAAGIRNIATAHPDWPPSRIAKRTGQPESTVKRALANWTPPPRPDGEAAE
jgi:putative DNA primase/helicase